MCVAFFRNVTLAWNKTCLYRVQHKVKQQQLSVMTSGKGEQDQFKCNIVLFSVFNFDSYVICHFLDLTFISNGPFRNTKSKFHCLYVCIHMYPKNPYPHTYTRTQVWCHRLQFRSQFQSMYPHMIWFEKILIPILDPKNITWKKDSVFLLKVIHSHHRYSCNEWNGDTNSYWKRKCGHRHQSALKIIGN